MTETEIKQRIMVVGRGMGCKMYRMNAGKIRVGSRRIILCEEGTPDIQAVLERGRSLWVEVKKPGEKPTAIQLQRHRELRNLGHAVVVVDDSEQFVAAVQEVRDHG